MFSVLEVPPTRGACLGHLTVEGAPAKEDSWQRPEIMSLKRTPEELTTASRREDAALAIPHTPEAPGTHLAEPVMGTS